MQDDHFLRVGDMFIKKSKIVAIDSTRKNTTTERFIEVMFDGKTVSCKIGTPQCEDAVKYYNDIAQHCRRENREVKCQMNFGQ
jgi:hypothetical protein